MSSEPVSNLSTRAERIDYLLKQLDLAHRRNDLVDGLRYRIFQVLLAFHGVVLGATALGGSAVNEVRIQLGDMRWVLPAVVLVLGYLLFALFLRWHVYLYKYKTWIKNLESLLAYEIYALPLIGSAVGHSGTYSLEPERNNPDRLIEGVVGFTAVIMGIVNVADAVVVGFLMGAPPGGQVLIGGLGAVAHLFTAGVLLRWLTWRRLPNPPLQPTAGATSDALE